MICPAPRGLHADALGRYVVAYDSSTYSCLVVNENSGLLIDAEPPLEFIGDD